MGTLGSLLEALCGSCGRIARLCVRTGLLLFLILPAQSWSDSSYGQGYEFRITTTGLVPEKIVLSEARDGEWAAIDTVWQADDGFYHPRVAKFKKGLYTLQFGNQPPLPLLLSEPLDDLLVHLTGTPSNMAVAVTPECSTQTFVRFYQENDTCNAFRYLEQLGKNMLSPRDPFNQLMPVATAARINTQNYQLIEAMGDTHDALLKASLSLLATPSPDTLEQWWPPELRYEPSLIPSRMLKDHLEVYLHSQIDTAATRTAQDSLFLRAITWLLEQGMLPQMRGKLRHYATYFLQEIGAPELADYVKTFDHEGDTKVYPGSSLHHFALDMRKAQSMDLDGKKQRILDQHRPLTLILVYSIWCPHCMLLLPQIAAWYTEEVQKVLHITSLSCDAQDHGTLAFIRNLQLPWQSCIESEDSSSLLEALHADGTPYLLLFDREGHFIEQPLGLEQLKARVRSLSTECRVAVQP